MIAATFESLVDVLAETCANALVALESGPGDPVVLVLEQRKIYVGAGDVRDELTRLDFLVGEEANGRVRDALYDVADVSGELADLVNLTALALAGLRLGPRALTIADDLECPTAAHVPRVWLDEDDDVDAILAPLCGRTEHRDLLSHLVTVGGVDGPELLDVIRQRTQSA